MAGAANRNESIRSRMPPWPGMSVPESLAPAARLSIDSARSPAWAVDGDERSPSTQAADGAAARAQVSRRRDDDRPRWCRR